MEGSCNPESPPRHLSPSASSTSCNRELTRWNSGVSFFTAENCRDVLRPSENEATDDRTAWTDEKHDLYIHQLEMTFVKRLPQSKSVLAQCSEQRQNDLNISRRGLINTINASEQFIVLRNDCWKRINCVMGELPSCNFPATSCAPLKSNKMHNFKYMGKHRPSAKMPEFLKFSSTMKHGKRMMSHGLARSSQKFSPCKPLHRDLFDLTQEGMGQNFFDENNQKTSDFESQSKRLKPALEDTSKQDQQNIRWSMVPP